MMEKIEKYLEAGQAFKVRDLVFVNATPHPINVEGFGKIDCVTEIAKILTARAVEKHVNTICGVTFVTTEFMGTEEGYRFLKRFRKPGNKIYFIGSIIAAQAYGYPVVSPITTPETTRAPPEEKVCYRNKFNVYWRAYLV